jgi:hypothetical protein
MLARKIKIYEESGNGETQHHCVCERCPSSGILNNKIPVDGQVHKASDSECYTSSSEHIRVYEITGDFLFLIYKLISYYFRGLEPGVRVPLGV